MENTVIQPDEVIEEMRQINPLVLELAMERVARKKLQNEISQLRQVVDGLVIERAGGVDSGEADEDEDGSNGDQEG